MKMRKPGIQDEATKQKPSVNYYLICKILYIWSTMNHEIVFKFKILKFEHCNLQRDFWTFTVVVSLLPRTNKVPTAVRRIFQRDVQQA